MGTGHGPIILTYGSEKFWFIEDNTIKGSGSAATSGGVDAQTVEDMSRDIIMFRTPLLEVMAQKAVRIAVSDAIKSITTPFTGQSAMVVTSHRSGSTIWHDNTFLGRDPGSHDHTNLPYYRQLGLVSNDLSNWGFADGANGWD